MDMEREIQILNIDDILPNRFQPRIQFNDRNINELADSIKEHGVIQPIVVRKVSDKYEIIAGERRYKASILAGKTTIPAIITNLDDKNSAEIALIENVQRQDLTPIEEAVSYKKILDMGYLTQNDLAEKLGKTQSTIANKLRLLNLDDEVQEALLDGKISERHARSLLKLDNSHQIIMLNRIIDERLTVRKTDEEIDKLMKSTKNIENTNESEGTYMDEKIINDFNIPSNPIIENTNENNNIENNVEIINPGFMDIDKIEENAVDLFRPDPSADLDMLLEKPIEPVVEVNPMAAMQPVIEENNDSQSESPKGGKFFSMFGLTQEEDVNPNYVSDLESKEANMDFGIPTPSQPQFNPFENSIQNEIKEEPVIENNTVENVFGIDNNDSTFENTYNFTSIPTNDNLNNVSNVEPVVETNILSNEEPMFNPIKSYSLNDDVEFSTSNEQPVVETENIDNSMDQFEKSLFESNNEIKEEAITPLEPVVETVYQTPETPVYQSVTPIYDDTLEEKQTEEVINVGPTTSLNAEFRTVINTIRECAKTIEKYGFKIETEEIDFEDSYQVNFKIDKN